MKLEQVLEGIQRRTKVFRPHQGKLPGEVMENILDALNKAVLPGEPHITLKDLQHPIAQKWLFDKGLNAFLERLYEGDDEGQYFIELSHLLGRKDQVPA